MSFTARCSLPALLFATLACSTAPGPETAAPAPAVAATESADPSLSESADPFSTCYFGPSTQTAVDGSERPGAELMVRRTVDRAASRIVEETARFDAVASVAPRRYMVVYEVDGDAFTLTETSGAFAGSGTFTAGEPWAWTAWTTTYTLPSGIRVESKVELAAAKAGALTAERTAYGPDGGKALILFEALAAIEGAECERRFAELPPPG